MNSAPIRAEVLQWDPGGRLLWAGKYPKTMPTAPENKNASATIPGFHTNGTLSALEASTAAIRPKMIPATPPKQDNTAASTKNGLTD